MRDIARSILALALLVVATPSPICAGEESGGAAAEKEGAIRPKKHRRVAFEPKHDGLGGRFKSWQVELAIPAPGDYRVWVYDSGGSPIPLKDIAGTLTVTPDGGASVELALALSADLDHLASRGDPLAGALDVAIRITGLAEAIKMDLHFENVGVAKDEPPSAEPGGQSADSGPPAR